jgi:hypothetical protein
MAISEINVNMTIRTCYLLGPLLVLVTPVINGLACGKIIVVFGRPIFSWVFKWK